jgi:hypothetical protein
VKQQLEHASSALDDVAAAFRSRLSGDDIAGGRDSRAAQQFRHGYTMEDERRVLAHALGETPGGAVQEADVELF